MTKPGYKEEPSLKVSFSRHVMCVKEKPNIKICTTLDPQIDFGLLAVGWAGLWNKRFWPIMSNF